jgi:hypothetical protein
MHMRSSDAPVERGLQSAARIHTADLLAPTLLFLRSFYFDTRLRFPFCIELALVNLSKQGPDWNTGVS